MNSLHQILIVINMNKKMLYFDLKYLLSTFFSGGEIREGDVEEVRGGESKKGKLRGSVREGER